MSMTKAEHLKDLFETMESLRQLRYPDVPAELVGAIIEIQSQHLEDKDKGEGKRRISALIADYLLDKEVV